MRSCAKRALFQDVQRTAGNPAARFFQPINVEHQPQAQVPGRAGAERFAGEHRNPMLLQQALGKILGANSGFKDIDHH